MSGSQTLTAFVGVLYLATAGFHVRGQRYGLALAFAAYALANVGLILAERGR